MPVLDLTSRIRTASVVLEASPAYELLVTIAAITESECWDACDVDPAWFAGIRAQIPADLLAVIDGEAGRPNSWLSLVAVVHALPAPRTVEAFLAALEAMPAADLYVTLLGGHFGHGSPAPREELEQAACGNATDRAALAARLVCDEDGSREGMRVLAAQDPEAVKTLVVDLLRRFNESVFATLAPAATAALERDVAMRAATVRGRPVAAVVEAVTNGVSYEPEEHVRTVLLVPHVAMRPWVLISEHDDIKVFVYPVAEEALRAGTDSPPERLVVLCKALAEEQRLRLLRHLADGPLTLQEVADRLGVAKSTAHHHLVILRAAGLVTVTLGADREYSLRHDSVPDVGALLEGFLKGVPGDHPQSTVSPRSRGRRR